jgi:hypothetical protein
MNGDESDLKDCIELDLDWLKKELEDLTIEQRCIILDEYIERTQKYGVGIVEYKAFVEAFNNLEE